MLSLIKQSECLLSQDDIIYSKQYSHMSRTNSHLEKKVPELNLILERIKEEMRIRGDTQKSLSAKIPCHAGQLSKALSGYTLPSANILIGMGREGYDMNYILRGEKEGTNSKITALEKKLELAEHYALKLEQLIR